MKVELSIKDDKELRNLIKDMIRGQVVNIARKMVRTIVETEAKRLVGKLQFSTYTKKAALENAVKSLILEEKDNISKQAVEYIFKTTKHSVIDIANDTLTKEIKDIVEKSIGNKLYKMPVEIVVGNSD